MDSLSEFAVFLKEYGAYAMASVFFALYALERRERRATQTKYEKYLESVPAQNREFMDAQADAVESLERAFLRSGIHTESDDDDRDEDR